MTGALHRPHPGAKQMGGDANWWRGAVIYQVYPRSFYDGNDDGIGDLDGITRKLDHIADLGVDAIWLSPHFVSPMDDFGYDVADYRDVDPIFGTLADFDALTDAAHERGLRILIDLVLSHTSDRHPWFAESRADRTNLKADWYVWADAKPDGTAPNNWLSIFGGTAWAWDTRRRQYYLHNFLVSQPDLNFHNLDVQNALLDVARYWLDRGVDGFRLDTANKYFHDADLRDNPPMAPGMRVTGISPDNPYGMQQPIFSVNRPETLAFHERLRAVMDEYPGTVTVGELGARLEGGTELADYTAPKRLHMAYSFDLLGDTFTAGHIRKTVEHAEAAGATWSSWPFSNHDVKRVVSRFGVGTKAAPMLIQLLTCLRGTPTLYQGEELGLPEADVPYEKLRDPYGLAFWPAFKGRDGCRTPIPWEADRPNAGFSEGEPWLPVPDDHAALAVSAQAADPASPLNRTRAFLSWRKDRRPLLEGDIVFHDAPEPVLAFTRLPPAGANDAERLLCLFNLGESPLEVDTRLPDLGDAGADGIDGTNLGGGKVRLEPYGAFIGVDRTHQEGAPSGPITMDALNGATVGAREDG
ncbi:MAG: alpha-glucosidase [Pseudomonadota bacterium]